MYIFSIFCFAVWFPCQSEKGWMSKWLIWFSVEDGFPDISLGKDSWWENGRTPLDASPGVFLFHIYNLDCCASQVSCLQCYTNAASLSKVTNKLGMEQNRPSSYITLTIVFAARKEISVLKFSTLYYCKNLQLLVQGTAWNLQVQGYEEPI